MRAFRLVSVLVVLIGTLALPSAAPAAPSNDDWPGTPVPSLPFTTQYDLNDATAQSSEPRPPCDSEYTLYTTVWYSFTPDRPMRLGAQATSSAGATIAIYTGESLKSLSSVACGFHYGSWGQPSTVALDVTPGTTYHLQVAPYPYYRRGTGELQLFEVQPPANDNFADREVLSGFPVTHVGPHDIGASAELGEPKPSCHTSVPARTVWHEWTSDRTGTVIFDQINGHPYATLAVWQGSDFGSLVQAACTNYIYPAKLEVIEGQTYLFQTVAMGDNAGVTAVNLNPQVPGDDFSSALEAKLGTNTATVFRATSETGEPAGCRGTSTVWFKISGYSGVLRIGSPTGVPGGYLGTYRDGWSDRLSCQYVGSNPSYVELQPDSTYYFGMSSWFTYVSESSPNMSFTLDAVDPPGNDEPEGAEQMVGAPATAAGDNHGARTPAHDPKPTCVSDSGASVWYRWTAPEARRYVVDTFGSGFDTTLAIYRGPISSLDEVACNDDHNRYQSRVLLDSQVGESYWIQVGGYRGARGVIQLHIGTEAANDDFHEAEVVGAGPAWIDVSDNTRATDQPNDPRPSCNTDGYTTGTIWYRYDAPIDGVVQVDALGSSFDTILAVYTGEHVQSLSEIACNDNAVVLTASQLTFQAKAGDSYFIMLGGWRPFYSSSTSYGRGTTQIRVISPTT